MVEVQGMVVPDAIVGERSRQNDFASEGATKDAREGGWPEVIHGCRVQQERAQTEKAWALMSSSKHWSSQG